MTSDDNSDGRGPRIIPFGKYKGQPAEILREDADYRDWLMGQDWFREKHQHLFTLIVNNFGAPAETPEHNAMQARFLQHEIAAAVVRSRINISQVEAKMNDIGQIGDALGQAIAKEQECVAKEQECKAKELQCGADFDRLPAAEKQKPREQWLRVPGAVDRRRSLGPFYNGTVRIELKPSLGDDYPGVLRTMKANGGGANDMLIIGQFCARGASLEQVRQIFAADDFRLMTMAEIEALARLCEPPA
jgi:hypothetical protein